MALTSNDVANQAIQLIGDNNVPAVSGQAPIFDTSPAGIALKNLYASVVQTVARQSGWDFARHTVVLAATGNAPPFPWTFEYGYPAGVEVWQLMPSVLADPNNPLPVNWVVANAVVGSAQVRVIHTNLASAQAVFNNAPTEAAWDSLFRESVARLLASELAMALASKPDSAQSYLQSGGAFESIGEERAG